MANPSPMLLLATMIHAAPAPDAAGGRSLNPDFDAWRRRFGKSYPDAAAESAAAARWLRNDAVIRAHPRNATFKLAHSSRSDEAWHDFFRACVPSTRPLRRSERAADDEREAAAEPVAGDALPASVDWVARGGVSAVEDQGKCGSCWAFSTSAAVEGAAFAATGSLTPLSAAELVSCALTTGGKPMGCAGGWLDDSFDWMRSHGVESALSSPYTPSDASGRPSACNATAAAAAWVSGYVNVKPQDEVALRAAVATQPVAATVAAVPHVFQHYGGGVIDGAACGGARQNHAVLIVGYGTDETTQLDFWRVKNSWGPQWGEDGYFRIARGNNACAIEGQPAYPTVDA